ncbi:LysR family transcriptional regulator [Pseudomonas sp. NPDC090202]|uniref:LysR family transcriptional regulator n=1 Tax=unclassified Pseudomonas TaxID=196821 RepID=UPI0038237277
MTRNDLRRMDMSLLVVFEAMMHERNVSRVGEKLFLGQPAVSNALSRLRTLFGDPLFIRNGRSMEPTARAEDLFQILAPLLDTIAITLSQTSDFDPANSQKVFDIGLSDDVEYSLLPPLLRRLRREAPGIRLVIHHTDCQRISNLLGNGEISVGISYTDELPATAKRKFLRTIRPMVLRADGARAGLSLDEFCRRPHATVSSMGDLVSDTERGLKRLSRSRQVVLAVPRFSALPVLLQDSDLLAVVPDYVARAMTVGGALRADPMPLELGEYELSMVWRGVANNDPAERWLRSRFSELLSDHSRRPLSIAAA